VESVRLTTVPEAIEGNMGLVYFRKTFSKGSGEPDSHVVESQNYPLHISDDAREGFLANFLFNLPVVAIPHVSTPTPGQIVPACMRRFRRTLLSTPPQSDPHQSIAQSALTDNPRFRTESTAIP
jgi:hypothetical protein